MPVADLEHRPTETARNSLGKGVSAASAERADHNHHRQSSGRSVTDIADHEPRPTAVGPHRVRLSRAAGFRLPPNTRSIAAATRWANPFRTTKPGRQPGGRRPLPHVPGPKSRARRAGQKRARRLEPGLLVPDRNGMSRRRLARESEQGGPVSARDLRVGLVKLTDIVFHPHNVCRDLGDLRSLTASIARHGVMQPVVVEEYGDHVRLRAGHRRVAARAAGRPLPHSGRHSSRCIGR